MADVSFPTVKVPGLPSAVTVSGGVVCYGCKDYTIDGVRGEMVNGATRFIYFWWGC